MATALLNSLPYDVASKVNDYTAELSVTKRLNSGWRELHKELEWRVCAQRPLNSPMLPMRWPGYLVLKQTPVVPPYFLPLYNRLVPAMCQHISGNVEYSFATRYSTDTGKDIRVLNGIIKAAGILLGMPTVPLKDCLGEWIQLERAYDVANDTTFDQLPDFPDNDSDDESYWETDGEDWQGADWEPHEEDWDL